MLPKRDKKDQQSEHQRFAEIWREKHNLKWLFPDTEATTREEYLAYFDEKHGPLYLCRYPAAFKFELLEKYQDKVAFTQHITDPAVVPYTMLQFGADFHIAAEWIWNSQDRNFLVTPTVYYKKHSQYSDFLNENEEFQYFEPNKPFGFNTEAN